jgi:hypothetical protein
MTKATTPKATTPTTPKAGAYVPTPESLQAGTALAKALTLQGRAYGAVRAGSVALWQSVGAIDAAGTWVPGEYVSSERLAIATLPNRKGRTAYAAPVGVAARKAVQALPVGDAYGDWWRTVRAALKALDDAAKDAGRTSTRAPKPAATKATPAPKGGKAAPTVETIAPDAIAREAAKMLQTIAKGGAPEGLTPKAAKVLQDGAAAAEALRAPAPVAPVVPVVSQAMAAQAIAGWLKSRATITPELLKVCEAVMTEHAREAAARAAATAKANATRDAAAKA